MTSFAALAQQFLRTRGLVPDDAPPGRMIAIAGDAEFDEGNVFEALLEAWKHRVTDVWWIIDYNRQSLDAIVADRFFHRLDTVFETMEWRVVTLKYGRRLEAAFTRRGGRRAAPVDRRLPELDLFGPRLPGGARRGGRGCWAISGTPAASASCSTSTTTRPCTG